MYYATGSLSHLSHILSLIELIAVISREFASKPQEPLRGHLQPRQPASQPGAARLAEVRFPADRLALGCVNSHPMARGTAEAGFTQPMANIIALF